MKQRKRKTPAPAPQYGHESREDRARTAAGKTANSKVRSEGRALAALARTGRTMTAAEAAEARRLAALGWNAPMRKTRILSEQPPHPCGNPGSNPKGGSD
jgi:hypothetical protein